jgi:SAM-dependent methyltransferase
MSKMGLYIGNSPLTLDDPDNYFLNISYNNLRQFFTLDQDLFDIVIFDNCLQKLEEFNSIFDNAKRLLKNGGEFIVIVPDYRLYEKCIWPSKLNSNHLHSFSLNLSRDLIKRESHWNIEENLLPKLNNHGFDNFNCFLNDNNFDYDKPVLEDQTKDGASCYIFIKCQINKEN